MSVPPSSLLPPGFLRRVLGLCLAILWFGSAKASMLAGVFYQVEKSIAASELSANANQNVPMVVVGLNSSGLTVGFYSLYVAAAAPGNQNILHAFAWDDSTQTLQDLSSALPATSSMALCVNDAGMMAGVCWTTGGVTAQAGFVWQNGAAATFLSPEGADIDSVNAINASGLVIGTYYSNDYGNERAFVWDGTASTDLGDLGDPDNSYVWPQAINDSGQIVGTLYDVSGPTNQPTAFLWQNGSMNSLEGSEDFLNTQALGINNAGQIVGSYATPSKTNHHLLLPGGFYWADSTATDLGALSNYGDTAPFAIGASGQIFGTTVASDDTRHLFDWNVGSMSDLGPAALASTDSGYQMTSINASGEIAGFVLDANNKIQAALYVGNAEHKITDVMPAYLAFSQMSSDYGSQVLINDAGQVACAATDALGQQVVLLLNPIQGTVAAPANPGQVPGPGTAPSALPTQKNVLTAPSSGIPSPGGGGSILIDGSSNGQSFGNGAVITLEAYSYGMNGSTLGLSSGFYPNFFDYYDTSLPFSRGGSTVNVDWSGQNIPFPMILQRKINNNGQWISLGSVPTNSANNEYYDFNVLSNVRYFYRLVRDTSQDSSTGGTPDEPQIASNVATCTPFYEISASFELNAPIDEQNPYGEDGLIFSQDENRTVGTPYYDYIYGQDKTSASLSARLFTGPSAVVTIPLWRVSYITNGSSSGNGLQGGGPFSLGAIILWPLSNNNGVNELDTSFNNPVNAGDTQDLLVPQAAFAVADMYGGLSLSEKATNTLGQYTQFEITLTSGTPSAKFSIAPLASPFGDTLVLDTNSPLLSPPFAYQLSWDSAAFQVYCTGNGTEHVLSNGGMIANADLLSQAFDIRATGTPPDGQNTTITLTILFNGVPVTTDTFKVTYKIDPKDSPYTVPFDEASGARYRKIALNGRPMPDDKPQHTAESDQQKEETYIDALTLGLRHSTTDVYVPVAGSDLVLSARRNTLSEGWSMRSGLRPHERYDRPFGVAWNSNLCINIDRTISSNPSEPIYAYVTDQSGSAHRFLELPGGAGNGLSSFVPLPSSNQENGDYLTSLTAQTGAYVFTDRFGTAITYSTATPITVAITADRVAGSSTIETHNYYCASSVADRLGNSLVYTYPTQTTLVPSTITFQDPAGQAHPDQTIYIRQDDTNHITAIWDPNGNEYDFAYTPIAYTANGNQYTESSLASVTGPGGVIASYQYDLSMEADTLPPDSNGLTTPKYHCDVTAITDGRLNSYQFAYQFDQTKYDYSSQYGYFPQTGAPRNVTQVTLPNSDTVTLTNNSITALTTDASGNLVLTALAKNANGVLVPTSASQRQNWVIDPQGTKTSYTFTGAQVFLTNDLSAFYTNPLSIPKVVLYTEMDVDSFDTVHNTDFGTETFTFDVTAGLALSSAKDLSGNTTSYVYGDNWSAPANYRNVFAPFAGYNGQYPDPTVQTNAQSKTKHFTYAPPWQIMTDSVDELSRTTHTDVDNLGRRTSEIISDPSGNVVQQTTFTYGNTSFPGVVTQRTVHHANSDPAWATDLVVAYGLDTAGRVLTETVDPSGHPLTTTYSYDKNGNKLSSRDPLQHTTSFGYDDRNRLVETVYADGTAKFFDYDAASNKTQEVDENGNYTTFGYDLFNRLSTQTRHVTGGDLVTQYAYNDANSKTQVTDPNGNVTLMTYDGLQRLSTTQDPIYPATQYAYNTAPNAGGNVFESASFKPTQVIDPRGWRTQYAYDSLYRTTAKSVEYKANTFSTTSYGYDNVGNQTSVTEPAAADGTTRTTVTTYDALNRATLVTHPDLNTVATSYTATGLKWQVADELGNTTQTQYDAAGRAVFVLAPMVNAGTINPATGAPNRARPTTQTIYDDGSRVSAQIDPLGNRTDFGYDLRNRKVQVQGPPVVNAATSSSTPVRPATNTGYDYAGNVLWMQDPRGYVTQTSYDEANRPSQVIAPPVPVFGGNAGNPTTNKTYDFNGNVLTATDPNGHTTTNTYDALNRLHTTQNAALETVTYEYDAVGNRTRVTDGKQQATAFTYDGLNRNTSNKDMAGQGSTFTYDALFKTSRQDANTQITNYTYDQRDRLGGVAYPSRSADNRTYNYDAASNLLSVLLPPMAGASDNVADVAYAYDELHRVTGETSHRTTHAYTFDLNGNRLSATYGGTGRQLVSVYDALNRLSTLGDGASISGYGYDLSGNVQIKTLPNGESIRSVHDGLGRLAFEEDDASTGVLYQYVYLHDLGGNLRQSGEYSAGLNPPQRTVTMAYDSADRLISEAVTDINGNALSTTGYGYDAAGNRATKTVAGGPTTTYSFNGVNELMGFSDSTGRSVTYGYDNAGNRLGRTEGTATDVYGYDAENRLVSLSKAGVAYAYAYDYRTRRVQRNEGATATGVVFSGGTSVQEYPDSATNPSVEFIRGSDWGGGVGGILYSVRRGEGASYAHYDVRGDITARTAANGVLTYQAAYEAWGTRTSEFGSDQDRQRANTKEEDPTGLLDEGMRYRDLETGVFITRDPAGMVDGPNLYAYVRQNPWTKFDPEGLQGVPAEGETPAEEAEMIEPEREAGQKEQDEARAEYERHSPTTPVMRAGGAEGEENARNEEQNAPKKEELRRQKAQADFVKKNNWMGNWDSSDEAGKNPEGTDAKDVKEGGSHKQMAGDKNDDLDSHHIPSSDSLKESGLTRNEGPAIKMDPLDHQQTASWGRSADAQAYRAKQAELIGQGKFEEAQNLDIEDVRSKFGEKYDVGIQQARDYTRTIPKEKTDPQSSKQ